MVWKWGYITYYSRLPLRASRLHVSVHNKPLFHFSWLCDSSGPPVSLRNFCEASDNCSNSSLISLGIGVTSHEPITATDSTCCSIGSSLSSTRLLTELTPTLTLTLQIGDPFNTALPASIVCSYQYSNSSVTGYTTCVQNAELYIIMYMCAHSDSPVLDTGFPFCCKS